MGGLQPDPPCDQPLEAIIFRCASQGRAMADESLHLRVAARFLRAGYFAVGDLVWQGKYKNKLGIITAFGVDAKGNPTITVSPIPKGRKQDKTFSLFKVWKVRPEQIEDLKAKGKIAASRELEVPDPLPAYVPSAKKPTLFTREDGIEIAGGLWQDAQSSSSGPVPQLAFVARFGPEAAPKLRKKNPIDYPVMALEGLWWTNSGEFDFAKREPWKWTLMIMQPKHITENMFQQALQQVRKKRDSPELSRIRLELS